MITYMYTEARQKLASVLEQAAKHGEVRIKRRDGQVFVVKPQTRGGSPLDVEGLKLRVSRDDIVESIKASRKSRE